MDHKTHVNIKNYEILPSALDEIQSGNDEYEYAAKGSGLLSSMEKFDTFLV